MPNHLITETSPYLLQHAHNPVNWYPWSEEALHLAKKESKIIVVSIGYAACHWCHVMEKESFENDDVAKVMNENFINIKVDREERPDIDGIYMDAVQAITGSGGWPLNVFLTPDAKPFYGGTYFPPINAYNRSSWTDVLLGIKKAWAERPEQITEQAETLTSHLHKSDFSVALKNNTEEDIFTTDNCHTIATNILQKADAVWGGFGNAPKFPQTFTIQYLLQYYHFTKKDEALEQALLSINKMLDGGIYDHLAGGLARYSTDAEWLAPHFEKMLYDNALLLNILADAYQLTKNKTYEKAIHHIVAFIKKELMDANGGFYAAMDADSEGEEGKFYVWQKEEIERILKEDAKLFCVYFDVSENGNWEHKNILRILKPANQFAIENNLTEVEFEKTIDACKQKLLQHRSQRIRPITDDKILLGWNALMITALCKASAALNYKPYITLAQQTFDFVLEKFSVKKDAIEMHHTYKNGVAKYPAFLDDYAFLIQAAIHLQEVTFNTKYLHLAKQLIEHITEHFFDETTGYFFFTNKAQTDVIVRKKEVYDGAIPSGNSTMTENLFYLSIVFNNPIWHNIANKMISQLQVAIVKYPTSFCIWASTLLKQTAGINEIAILGQNVENLTNEVLEMYIPNKILQASTQKNNDFPLLANKEITEKSLIYSCFKYSCYRPINTANRLLQVLKENNKFA
jgi:uncharacterized protein YyaL (SSP411 family)